MLTKQQLQLYGIIGLVLIVAVWLFIKKGGALGFSLGKAAVETAGNLPVGAVVGAGTVLGIPQTDAQQCAYCKKIRDWFGVSKFCSASDFLTWTITGK